MRKVPEFRSFDAFFDYLVKKLRHGAWDTNPVRHDFTIFAYRYDMEKRKQPLAKFLATKADKLIAAGDTTVLERLRAHVRRYFAQQLKWKLPEWVALVEKLSGPRTAASTTYVFKREGAYNEQKIAKLSAAEQKQFLVAAGKYLGGKFRAAPAFFKKLRAEDEGVDIQRWRISDKRKPKTPVYEMWTFMVDNGTVFPLGKPTVAVEMVQGTFQSKKDNADLAADLQAVVPF